MWLYPPQAQWPMKLLPRKGRKRKLNFSKNQEESITETVLYCEGREGKKLILSRSFQKSKRNY